MQTQTGRPLHQMAPPSYNDRKMHTSSLLLPIGWTSLLLSCRHLILPPCHPLRTNSPNGSKPVLPSLSCSLSHLPRSSSTLPSAFQTIRIALPLPCVKPTVGFAWQVGLYSLSQMTFYPQPMESFSNRIGYRGLLLDAYSLF